MESKRRGDRRWLAIAGKILALLWAGWWTFFAVAVVISEHGNPWNVLRFGWWLTLIPLGVALIALRWEKLGGILLVNAGITGAIIYPLFFKASTATIVFMLLTLAAPPLTAGIMIFVSMNKETAV